MDIKKAISKDNPAIIGNRVKSARMLSGNSRQSFSTESKISMATLRAWEEPTKGRSGLTHKGALRFVKSLREKGIHCTEDWLLSGNGIGPKILLSQHDDSSDTDEVSWGEEEAIFRDIDSFKSNNSNSTVAIITDSSMLPKYSYGDYVGGLKLSGDEVFSLIGTDCIIETADRTIIRRIASFSNKMCTLVSLNLDASIQDAIITNIEIKSAAEIIWHRWRRKHQDTTMQAVL